MLIKAENKINKILKEFFYVLSAAIVIFSVLELVHSKIVLAYFNINYLLIFWLVIAILILVTNKEDN